VSELKRFECFMRERLQLSILLDELHSDSTQDTRFHLCFDFRLARFCIVAKGGEHDIMNWVWRDPGVKYADEEEEE